MARLREVSDSEDELPTLNSLIYSSKGRSTPQQLSPRKPVGSRAPSKTPNTKGPIEITDTPNQAKTVKATSKNQGRARVQRPLGIGQVNPLLLPISVADPIRIKSGGLDVISPPKLRSRAKIRESPRKASPRKVSYTISDDESDEQLYAEDSQDESDDFSDFIVKDSASEAELRRPASRPSRKLTRTPRKVASRRIEDTDTEDDTALSKRLEVVVLDSPGRNATSSGNRPETSRSTGDKTAATKALEEFFDEPEAHLKFSPSPRKPSRRAAQAVGFVTPPGSPSKPKLQSPSKIRPRIPQSPHRPSIDAFWSQTTINDWNDQYSPQKPLKSFRELPGSDDSDFPSPSASPRKSPAKSPIKFPTKKDELVMKERKEFETTKDALASAFIHELDQTITAGQIAALSSSTGGIRIVWSKKLQSTAGRASWKRETVRSQGPSTSTSVSAATATTSKVHHHASIELASKVISSRDRLLNVLAHEFCHLCNFMISGVKNQPHGASFKAWASKVTSAFAKRGVEVTTKHSYVIEYKYIWECDECGCEYKRHSKSIDTARQRCGRCKGELVQVKPRPKGASEKGEEYRRFVKGNYGRVKEGLGEEGRSMGKVMAALSREFRELKRARDAVKGAAVDVLKGAREVETVTVEEEGEDDGQLVVSDSDKEDEFAGRFDSLNLGN